MKRTTWILSIALCVFLAGASNGVMDTLQFHYGTSIFAKMNAEEQQYWQPAQSWKNKYKDYDAGQKEEAFPFSKTALVSLTDGWHFFQFLMLSFFSLAILIAMYSSHFEVRIVWQKLGIVLVFCALKLIFSVGFHSTYSYFLLA